MSCANKCGKTPKKSKIMDSMLTEQTEQGLFPVEKIVGKRIVHGQVQYKIRWQGYSRNEDSWEPEMNLGNISQLIAAYQENMKSKCSKFNKRRLKVKVKTSGRYEYVPQSELVAPKTKYFDDIRDGKIDLTKNDMYSRVKTRKRLQMESDEPHLDEARLFKRCFDEEINIESYHTEMILSNDYSLAGDKIVVEKSGSCGKEKILVERKGKPSHEFKKLESQNLVAPRFRIGSRKKKYPYQTFSKRIRYSCSNGQRNFNNVSYKRKLENLKHKLRKRGNMKLNNFGTSSSISGIYANPIIGENLTKSYSKYCRNLYFNIGEEESQISRSQVLADLKNSIINNNWTLFQNTIGYLQNLTICPDEITLISLAIQYDRALILSLLLENGVSTDSYDSKTGKSALMLASELGRLHCVKILLDNQADSDKRNYENQTALNFAIQNGRLDVVKQLLNYGTNFYAIDSEHTAVKLISKLRITNSVDTEVLNKINDAIQNQHFCFSHEVFETVNEYLTRNNLLRRLTIMSNSWINVASSSFETTVDVNPSFKLNFPILLIVHGIQTDENHTFWMDEGPCLVNRVYFDGLLQGQLKSSPFVTTLCPFSESLSHKLKLDFRTPQNKLEKRIRIAVIALDVKQLQPENL